MDPTAQFWILLVVTLVFGGIQTYQTVVAHRQLKIMDNRPTGTSDRPAKRKILRSPYMPVIFMMIVLVLNWMLYLTTKPVSLTTFMNTSSFQTVMDKTFEGETVVLDGKTFTGCTFKNVEFVFHGRQGFQMTYDKFLSSPIMIRTDNPSVFMMMHWVGRMDQESGGHTHIVMSLVDDKGNIVNK